MGYRAQYVIVEGCDPAFYHDRLGSNAVPRDLLMGPQEARWAITRLAYHEEFFYSEGSCLGGVLIDRDESVLLWWGGEDITWDLPAQRVVREIVASAWCGWDVRWAHGGIADLAMYIGIDECTVLMDGYDDEFQAPNLVLPEDGRIYSILSIRGVDGVLKLVPVYTGVVELVWGCDELVATAACAEGLPAFDLGARAFPTGGAHIDAATKQGLFWTVGDHPDIQDRVADANPGWTMSWQRDRFESHLEAVPQLRLPVDRERAVAGALQCLGCGEDHPAVEAWRAAQ
jgi:hypothetical protein